MPELDGYAVTRAIRTAESAVGTRIPIIAVTANAMAEDRQRCHAAGMDDHLAEPFRRSDLVGLLARWLNGPHDTQLPRQPTVAHSVDQAQRNPESPPAEGDHKTTSAHSRHPAPDRPVVA